MAQPTKIVPVKCNLDLAPEYMDNMTARFIKNLTPYIGANNEYEGTKEGQNVQKLKALQANELYVNIPIPEGENFCIGAKGFPETKEVYVMVWNSLNNHFIYRLNCNDRTFNIVKIDPCFNFQKKPKHFIGITQMTLTILKLVEPETDKEITVKELKWVDGFNYNGYLRVDDSIATNGFDANLFPYFVGNYDKCPIVRMGVPTPKGCINITEVPRVTDPTDPNYDVPLNNNLLFQKWFFIIRYIDVWGRPSEWGARSLEYVPGINDCISNSNNIPRCLNLEFDAGNPFINNIEIGWLSCSNGVSTVWHKEETLFLYKGSNIGEWWKRERNSDVNYNPDKNTVTYKFCRSKECQIIPPDETLRLENPLPKVSQSVIQLNKNTALFNNKSKFNPFPQDLTSKIKATVETPPQIENNLRNITIYVPIWNEVIGRFQQVEKDGTNGYKWGGVISATAPALNATARDYSQFFTNKNQKGFNGYLVGAGAVISTQESVINGVLVEDTDYVLRNGMYFQKFTFTNVLKGVYTFRLSSHLSDPNSEANYRDTSTTVWGKCPFSKANNYSVTTGSRTLYQELTVDVCNKDYNTMDENEILVILDCAGGGAKVMSGYVYGTTKNGFNEDAIELANVNYINGQFGSLITDHNGYYYYATRGNGRSFTISLRHKCQNFNIVNGQSNVTGMEFHNFIVDGYASDYSSTICNEYLIKGRLVLNGTNIGIPNAVVYLTRGKVAVTDDDGFYTIRAHDYVNRGVRQDKVIISVSGCGYTGPNGSCIGTVIVPITECTSCQPRGITLDTILLQYSTAKSLLSGGTYGIGVVGWDWLGRATYVQPLGYINIPTINQLKGIAPSQVKINIDQTATFPPEIQYITFFITPETTTEKYLDWIVDDVDFIDSQGLINTTAPTQIKIYYGSIIQYSKIHNFNTTTAWDFIPEGKNTPALSDRIQFFINGDGQYFTRAISGLVKYDQTGSYFTIDYVTALKDLKKNALIRLMRPRNCSGDEPYYEVCGSKVEIINGKAQTLEFILNAFDTYYLNRQIPVPVPQVGPTTDKITTSITTGDTTVATEQTPVPTPTILELRILGFKFEHFAPSNFWGGGCSNVGRKNAKNPYEAELIQPYQCALSGALSINGQLNYLCYFDDRKTTDFEVPESGGITGAFADVGKIFLICQTDSFLVGYNDNLGRVNENGTFQAPSTPNEFGKPQRKEGDTYGCALPDKLSIQIRNGKIIWIDRNRAEIVRYDYSEIKSFTKGQCEGWMKAKVKNVLADENKYFAGSINPATGEYLGLNNSVEGTTYTNQERRDNPLVPETVSFDIEKMELKTWFLFTPEAFSFLDGDILNVQLFSFKQGLAYSHYNGKENNVFNTFYGVKGEKVLTPVYNEDAFAKKMFLCMTLYCENQKFFSDHIITESKQLSRLLLDVWEKGMYFSVAAFLCDLNTIPDPNMVIETGVNKLYDGDRLYGNWLQVRLIGDPAFNDCYCEILGITVESFKLEKS